MPNMFSAMQSRYGDTKVLSLLLVRALAQRLENTPIIVNTVTPGFCYSNLRESLSGIVYYLSLILEALFANTAEEGSRQIILGATYGSGGEEEEKLRGAYIQYDSIAEPSDWAISEEGKKAQDKLWVSSHCLYTSVWLLMWRRITWSMSWPW